MDYANDNTSENKSFKYKTKTIEKTLIRPARPPVLPEGGDCLPRPPLPPLKVQVTIPLKYINNCLEIS